MRAVRCEEYGEPTVLVVRDVPEPSPRRGEIVVDVRAAALNFPDVLAIADKYQVSTPVPFTPGSEFAGVVSAVGEDVSTWTDGDEVVGAHPTGAFAERIAVPADAVSAMPPGLTMAEAAAFCVTYTTAFHSLVSVGGLKAGEWVVVLGAAGGVGSAAVDVASRLGARVVACASSPDRLALAAERGAVAVIDYTSEDLEARVKEITGVGADLVIDPVGAELAEPALRGLRWGGRFVTVGFAGGSIPRIPLNLVLLKNVTLRGLELRSWLQAHPEDTLEAELTLDHLLGEGMRPLVSRSYPLEAAADALTEVAARRSRGKVVLEVAQP